MDPSCRRVGAGRLTSVVQVELCCVVNIAEQVLDPGSVERRRPPDPAHSQAAQLISPVSYARSPCLLSPLPSCPRQPNDGPHSSTPSNHSTYTP